MLGIIKKLTPNPIDIEWVCFFDKVVNVQPAVYCYHKENICF